MDNEEVMIEESSVSEAEDHSSVDSQEPVVPPACLLSNTDIDRLADALLRRLKES